MTQIGIRIVVRGSKRTRVLIVCDGQFLALKHWLGDGSWTLPGGGLHNSEPVAQGAKRETQEEIGLMLNEEDFEHLGSFQTNDNGFKFTYDLFIVHLSKKTELRLQTIEILEAKWFSANELSGLRATSQLRRAVAAWHE